MLKGIPCAASASVTRGVKVGHALALGETFCMLTVVFEIILRDHAETGVFALGSLHMHPSAQGSAEGVSNRAVVGVCLFFLM